MDNHTDMKDDILKKISSNKVTMRSKIYFRLEFILLGLLSFIIIAISVFIFNFILWSIHAQAIDAFLNFGQRGIMLFLVTFPWMLLIIDLVLIFVLQWIIRKFYHGYRKPILFGLIGVFIVITVTGTIIDTITPVNDFIYRGDSRFVPSQIRDVYRNTRQSTRPMGGTCLCVITAIGTSTLTVENAILGTTTKFTVLVPQHGRYATTSSLSIGDTVIIAGDKEGNVIEAFGIRKIESR